MPGLGAVNSAQNAVLEENADTLQFPEEIQSAEPLSIAEVNLLLTEKSEKENRDEDDIEINEASKKGMKYCEDFSKVKNKDTLISIKSILTASRFFPYEISQLVNLCPDSAEEAKTLVPSYTDKELQDIIDEVSKKLSFDVTV